MGWQPEPHWSAANKQYRVQIRGRRVWLGNDWGEALRRCGELLAESGMGHLRERPLFVSELVLAHRGTNPTVWQKYITGEWVQFCGLTARVGYQYSAEAGNLIQGPFFATRSKPSSLHICAGCD